MRKIGIFLPVTVTIITVVSTAMAKDAKLPEDWKSYDLLKLGALIERFPFGSSEHRCVCAKIAPVVFENVLADLSKATALPSGQWTDLVRSLRDPLSPVERAHWRGRFRSALAQQDLGARELAFLGIALVQLDDNGLLHFLAEQLAETTAWQDGSPSDISVLRGLVAIPGGYPVRAVPARTKLFSVAVAKYLPSGPTDIQSEALHVWRDFARDMSRYLTAQQRAESSEKLRSAYSQKTDLRVGEMCRLEHVLQLLEDKEASAFLARLMEQTPDWVSAKIQDLANLAESLSRGTQTNSTISARAKLASVVLTKHLAESSGIRSAGLDATTRLARVLSRDISPEDRERWAGKLHSVFGKDELSAMELSLLSQALRHLGNEQGSLLVAQRMERGEALQSAGIDELEELAKHYAKKKDVTSWSIRRKLASVISTSYLTEASKAADVDGGTWARLARLLGQDLSDEECAYWRAKLRDTFARRERDLRELTRLSEAMRYLRDNDEFSFLARWLEEHDSWRCWPLMDYAAYLSDLAFTRTPRGLAARRRLLEHVSSMYLSDEAATSSVTCRLWLHIFNQFRRDLFMERRLRWIRRLRAAFVPNPEAIWAMDPAELMCLAQLLAGLKDKEASRLVSTYIYGSDRWQSLDTETLMGFARRTIVNVPDKEAKAARLRLAEHVGREYLLGKELALSAGRLPTFAAYFAGDMTPEARNCWAAKFWAAFAGNKEALAGLEEAALTDLFTCLRSLDAPDLIALIDKGRRCFVSATAAAGKSEVEGKWYGSAWPVLCWRVIAVQPSRRQAVWEKGVRQLLSDGVLPGNEIFKGLERLVAVLVAEETDSLSPVRVLEDSLRACQDYPTRELIRGELSKHRLQMYLDKAPSQFRDMTRRARKSTEGGNVDEARNLYSRLVTEADQAGHKRLSSLMRVELLKLLLEGDTADLNAVEMQLRALTSTDDILDEEIWNLKYRLLFQRLALASPADRETVWAHGIRALSSKNVDVSERTLVDLDELVNRLGESPLAERVVSDLLLLAPNLSSLRKLQLRRVSALARRGNWECARAAAFLDVILASGTSSGPFKATKECIQVMKAAGAPPEEIEALQLCFRDVAHGADTENKAATKSAVNARFDRLLEIAARETLRTSASDMSSRQKAFCHVLAGNPEDALKSMHAALAESCNAGSEIDARLDDMSVVLSVADGDIWTGDRFGRWLATRETKVSDTSVAAGPSADALLNVLIECEKRLGDIGNANETETGSKSSPTYPDLSADARTAIAKGFLKRRERNLVRWGIDALTEQDDSWPQNFWARAIGARGNLEEMARTILFSAEQGSQAKDVAERLVATSLLLRSSHSRRYLLHKVADVLFEENDFEGCLKLLERADALAEDRRERQDMSSGFLRVMSLIGLKRYEDATAALAEMEQWPGAAEERARVIYLTGWVYLKQNERAKALSVLRRGIETYPDASFSSKAREIVKRLEAD